MQVNPSVNVANFFAVGNQAESSLSGNKSTSAETKDFASFLDEASDNSQIQTTKESVSEKEPVSEKESVSDEVNTTSKNNEPVDSSEKKVEMKKDDMEESAQGNVVKENNDSDEVDEIAGMITNNQIILPVSDATDLTVEMEELPEEQVSAVLEVLGNLIQNVMQHFELSLEELNVKLEEFGMEMSDLLSKDGMKTFFLQMNQAEVSDLLVDENLNAQLESFMAEMEAQFETLDMIVTDVDDIALPENVDTVLIDFMDDKKSDVHVKSIVQEDVVVSEEPQVVVNNQTKDETAMMDTDQEQSQTDSKAAMARETVITKDSMSEKQATFENPILQAIQNAVNDVEGIAIPEQPNRQVDVVRQIVEQVRVNMNQQTTSLELQLYPEHLGRIQINVVSKEGVMTASIVAETEAAKQAVESGLLNLKEAMEQQELKVEAIEVMVSTMGFEKGDSQQNSYEEGHTSNSRRRIDLSELNDEIPAEDEAEIEKMKATGSSVSYMA